MCRLSPYAAHGQNPTRNGRNGLFLPEAVMTVLGSSGGRVQLDWTIGVA